MFKIIALLGVIAGGASYGLYAHTNLFGTCGESCSISKKAACCSGDSESNATPSCCANPCPSCEAGCDGCPACEVDCSSCCGAAAVAISTNIAKPKASSCCAKSACCDEPTTKVSAKKAACCANPCPACAVACDNCPICQVDCSNCCGASAKAAVAGPAAVLAGAMKK